MKTHIFDLTDRVFGNKKQLEDILDNYPTKSSCLVTREQKVLIIEFPGNCARYIDMRQDGVVNDVLVYSSNFGDYKFFTGRELDPIELE